MNRRIYIYQPQLQPELVELFSSISNQLSVIRIEEDFLVLNDEDYFNEEPIDYDSFRELVLEDIQQDITIFVEPYTEEVFHIGEELSRLLPVIPNGVFYFDDMIVFAVMEKQSHLKQLLLQYMNNKIHSDVIQTVMSFISYNMNSSVAAKHLYMHRNTLNYRIDNFIERTHINVKTFKGANAIYMLYHF